MPLKTTNITVEGADEVSKFLRRMPQRTYEDARKVFAKRAAMAHETVQENARTKLKRRTGHLARSIKFQVTGQSLETLEGHVYSGRVPGAEELPYVLTHEFGARISAKKAYKRLPGGPYLNIPLDDNKTPAGVTRMSAKTVFQQGGYIIRGRGAKFYVVHPSKGLMFALVKRVTVPPRLGMREAVEEQVPGLLKDLRQVIGLE